MDGHYRPLAGLCQVHGDRYVAHYYNIAVPTVAELISNIVAGLGDPRRRELICAERDNMRRSLASDNRDESDALQLPSFRAFTGPEDLIYSSQAEFTSKYGANCSCPFISTVILDGIARAGVGSHQFVPVPLHKTYSAHHPLYGAILIDITDLDNVSHGVVSSIGSFVRKDSSDSTLRPQQNPLLSMSRVWKHDEKMRGIMSLSKYIEYVKKFGLEIWAMPEEGDQDDQEEGGGEAPFNEHAYSHLPCASVDSLESLWPEDNTGGKQALDDRDQKSRKPASLASASIAALIRGLANSATVTSQNLLQLQHISSLRNSLLDYLKLSTSTQSNSEITTSLVRFVFKDAKHIALAGIRGLSFESLAKALGTEELRHAETLDLTVNAMHGNPEIIAPALLAMPNLKKVNLLTSPDVTDVERPSSQWAFLKTLLAGKDAQPLTGKMAATANYVLGFTKRLASDDLNRVLPTSPVCSIYTRRDCRIVHDSYSYHGFAVDHMMLGAEACVARLLHWVRTEWFGSNPHTFAYGPESLSSDRSPGPSLRPFPRPTPTYPGNKEYFSKLVHDHQYVLLIEDVGDRVAKRYWQQYAFVRRKPGNADKLEVLGAEQFLAEEAPDVDISGLAAEFKEVDYRVIPIQDPDNILEYFFGAATSLEFKHHDEMTRSDTQALSLRHGVWDNYPAFSFVPQKRKADADE